MPQKTWLECSFLIPVRRDASLSDGKLHSARCWRWLNEELFDAFGGRTLAPGEYAGAYRDPDTKKHVEDASRKYIVALPKSRVSFLRDLLRRACCAFQQKCIYLNVAGRVEFIEYPYDQKTEKTSR